MSAVLIKEGKQPQDTINAFVGGEFVGIGSVPVGILSSCQSMYNNVYQMHE